MEEDKSSDIRFPLPEAIRKAYQAGEEDEALEPIIKFSPSGQPVGRLKHGDSVIFYDIRGEREIELTRSLTEGSFAHFPIKKNLQLNFVTMIDYDPSLQVKVAFPADGKIKNTLAEVLSKAGLRLAKIAESEKAAHVGFFMNGKSDEAFPGEERVIVPSPQGISSYALKPEMSANLVAEQIFSKLKDRAYHVIVANLANVDVVGHIENKASVFKAIEAVDRELGKIVENSRSQGITLLVTSDHGTVEEWLYPDGTVNTGHTKNPVPFILADFFASSPGAWTIKEEGELSDVAPTVLELLGIAKPSEMTGQSLFINPLRAQNVKRRVLLLILDGWGLREEKEGNLIAEAQTPNFDKLWATYPHAALKASGEAVGLPPRAVGNSEAGHLHLGAGRRILLDRVKIDKAIENGSYFRNEAFLWAMEGAKNAHKSLHLLGIVSHYSSHGTIKHLFALLRLAKDLGLEKVYVHSFIGRRGEKPESGAIYLEKVEEMCRALSLGEVVTVIGRFWALDREENWDRVEKTYRALVFGEGTRVYASPRDKK
jgi:2,3-bisphosphoglycerate-independent phosphoglycerate mutase